MSQQKKVSAEGIFKERGIGDGADGYDEHEDEDDDYDGQNKKKNSNSHSLCCKVIRKCSSK